VLHSMRSREQERSFAERSASHPQGCYYTEFGGPQTDEPRRIDRVKTTK
jgi:hypothetical protein